jgi:hypothetical protein
MFCGYCAEKLNDQLSVSAGKAGKARQQQVR